MESVCLNEDWLVVLDDVLVLDELEELEDEELLLSDDEGEDEEELEELPVVDDVGVVLLEVVEVFDDELPLVLDELAVDCVDRA
jgi:hypothetical protein